MQVTINVSGRQFDSPNTQCTTPNHSLRFSWNMLMTGFFNFHGKGDKKPISFVYSK